MSDPYGRRSRVVDVRRSWAAEAEATDRVLYGLIGANVVVFVLWHWAPPLVRLLLQSNFLVSLEAVARFRVWTLLTYGFSHVDPMHLLFNMIGVWVFGRAVGQAWGARNLLQLYLVGAVMAGAGHVIYQLATNDPSPALGASGAVMALAAVYGATFPDRTILVYGVVPVPAGLLVGGYAVLDVLGLAGGGGGVAHAAHLAGLAYGLAWWAWSRR